MNCENCNKEHNGKYASGRFCSEKCAKGFSTKDKRQEINKKISQKLSYPLIIKTCERCKTEFIVKKKNQRFCSNRCARIGHITTSETKNKLSILRIKSIEAGNVGYGIKCNFEGTRCDSALEYAFCKWYKLKNPDSKIDRYKGFIEYKGIRFQPDFLIDNKIVVEVKFNKIGYQLNKKWKHYIESQKLKKEALDKIENSLWITNDDIGYKFYSNCLNEIKRIQSINSDAVVS
jgi:predicted nucleic acid-binding Zn ribbon protein